MYVNTMLTRKGLRYRLYPTPEQDSYLRHISGCVRLVYNLGLEQRRVFGRRGRNFRYEGQRAELKELKAAAPFLRDVPHHCLQEALVDLQTSFDRFFEGLSGFPKARVKHRNDGFRFPDPKQFRITPRGDGKYATLHLPKMGRTRGDHGALRVRLHRPLEGKIRSITLNHEAGVWHASFLCEVGIADPVRPAGEPVAVDHGVAVPIMVSDGTAPPVPVPTERQNLRERRLRQAVSRRKKGSANRKKAVQSLARHKAKEKRRRRHFLHVATTRLAKNHSQVVIEDLRVKNMTASARGTVEDPGVNVAQKSGLNRAILAVGWGLTATMLAYKVAWYGSMLLLMNPRFTSQECSACRHIDAASRLNRDMFRCVACGHAEHADLNAAKTILSRGLKMIATTPEDTRSGSACGALCVRQGLEAGNAGREAGSPVVYGGE